METGLSIHKFGGTSLATAQRYKDAAVILLNDNSPRKAVVVSAMSKVTDALIELVNLSQERNDTYLIKTDELKYRHLKTANELVTGLNQKSLISVLEKDFSDIREILRGVWLSKSGSEKTVELISGYGEVWSAQFLCAYLNEHQSEKTAPVLWLDAREVLVVEPGSSTVSVDWSKSQNKCDLWLKNNQKNSAIIITGFIASTADGIPTTLKRNGSDFSASIFGKLMKAEKITIWTDVDGVMSADPRLVPEAVVLDELSYNEATELAYFGAKVVHPSTMAPAIEDKIPIWIRNTFNPNFKGTIIKETAKSEHTVKGFATISDVALLNVEGTGMIGVPGVAQRLFGALKDVGVSVVMISQASSEHSICFAVSNKQGALAKTTVEKAFFAEIHHGQIEKVDIAKDCTILAAVGDNMTEKTGVAGIFFSALGRSGVNVRAIAQGSSERNISAVINGKDAIRGLRAVHSAFYLSNQTISIGIIGTGLIAGTFLDQLRGEHSRLKSEFKIDFRVRGIINTKSMILSDSQIDLANWKDALGSKSEPANLERFFSHIHADHIPHSVIIDCTASADIAIKYPEWIKKGVHIITPNKKANTGTMEFYRKIKESAKLSNCHYLYETTVGAGLPVINTLRDLVQTGDEIISIEGIFSGTLSYIFNTFDGSKPFSEIVMAAKQKGYTEPDPRDDLSGMDVARKLVILARESGLEIELDQIKVDSLVPKSLQAVPTDEYLKRLSEFDEEMSNLVNTAAKNSSVLRYVGIIDKSSSAYRVSLQTYKKDHAFSCLQGSDNIISFKTSRYRSNPLTVKGPGAGPEVTAAGVFADLLRLASYLGAP